MLRLLSFKAQGCKDFWKKTTSKLCHVSIYWKALAEYSQTHLPGLQPGFLHDFVLAKVATSSIRVKKSKQNIYFDVRFVNFL